MSSPSLLESRAIHFCASCGCSDDNACQLVNRAGDRCGCWWVSPHLCSACAIDDDRCTGPWYVVAGPNPEGIPPDFPLLQHELLCACDAPHDFGACDAPCPCPCSRPIAVRLVGGAR